MKLSVLLCTPFEQKPGIVSGGVNVWGQNIVKYHADHGADVDMTVISYDRRFMVQEGTSYIARIFWGIKEYLVAIVKTKKEIRVRHYDVLHLCSSAHMSLFKDYIVVRMANKNKTKSVIHFHFGRIPDLIKCGNWEWRMITKIAKHATAIVVMDQSSLNALKTEGINNVYYVPNPLSEIVINQIEECGWKNVERLENKVLYVGHVIPTKGVYELVEACRDISGVSLEIVGTVSEQVKRDLLNIASYSEYDGWLNIRGGVSHEKVIEKMLSTRIFVLPSYTEGFPNVILESMACECSIVSTFVGAVPEMLHIGREDVCGICVNPRDKEQLKNAIKKMLEDHDFAKTCGKNAKRRVYEMYTMPSVWHQLIEVWQRC